MARRQRKLTRKQIAAAFGRALSQARTEAGLTQEQLAGEAKLDRTTIGLYERGIKCPSINSFVRLADAIEVDPSTLFDMFLDQSGRRSN